MSKSVKNKIRRHRIEVLQRRLTYVRAKSRHDSSEAAGRWYDSEGNALEWALQVVEAAILTGTIHELERVALGDEVEEGDG